MWATVALKPHLATNADVLASTDVAGPQTYGEVAGLVSGHVRFVVVAGPIVRVGMGCTLYTSRAIGPLSLRTLAL